MAWRKVAEISMTHYMAVCDHAERYWTQPGWLHCPCCEAIWNAASYGESGEALSGRRVIVRPFLALLGERVRDPFTGYDR